MNELIFGNSRRFRDVIDRADLYANYPLTVLLTGETGVGKELIARRIHERSSRRDFSFVPINCGAIPPTLVESELFGFERGAFSGAFHSFKGLIRQAQGGTVFLDEVAELDLVAQVKLLRLLDSGEVRPIGSTLGRAVDVRVVAATNVDLSAAIARRRFRPDLFERLSVLPLAIPPLRDRKEDIPLIAANLVESFGGRVTQDAIEALGEYEWPGNVRQLRNLLLRASILGEGVVRGAGIQALLLQETERQPGAWLDTKSLEGTLADIEKQVIVERLRRCHGNRKVAARELGIAKSTLHEKLRRWREADPEGVSWPVSRWTDGLPELVQ